ncbi:hypothetical protein F6V25_15840 [Oryzomonas japonica]|uniref:SsuA/THI5-like domain-containing protein n=1 Tax=Oryzomonas japonica TaxID=2603858 RepID=A0A7J4ZMJ0_9BACT|nr:ABC transporter substrate-binding protein [Oryzomonas japonica]KAB0663893.1 hypothetical protein F6V25_15840 [Oryzomonas japonica]
MNFGHVHRIAAPSLMAVLLLVSGVMPCHAAGKFFRLGYLDHPGSALCRVAATHGHFREEGLQVKLVKFQDTASGLAALEAGSIDAGAFMVGEALGQIAKGKGFRIIAGGGTPTDTGPLASLDENHQGEQERRGIVVLVPANRPVAEKGSIIGLTAALIRAHRTLQQQSPVVRQATLQKLSQGATVPNIHFDPNPDYWRMLRIWQGLGLQDAAMPGDFLANHVYEEIYCDALDRLLIGPMDPVLQELFSKAVCTPNCCPANSGRLFTLQGGSTQ